ncbi:MAG: repressor LexA [Oscillospiraceae bacterium]|nr:repressor LexA [Oscillospiraceae bacterium]
MQRLNKENFVLIEDFVNCYAADNSGRSPSVNEIAAGLGLSKSTVSKYLNIMKSEGSIEFEGHRGILTKRMRMDAEGLCTVPVLGEVACGLPILAEENIEEYVRLPASLFGRGEFFILRAKGDSMTGAGIDEGDLILVRRQETADYNQIVVALVRDEATLKRFRPRNGKIYLHAENPAYEDIVLDECVIQGVAVKIIKDII